MAWRSRRWIIQNQKQKQKKENSNKNKKKIRSAKFLKMERAVAALAITTSAVAAAAPSRKGKKKRDAEEEKCGEKKLVCVLKKKKKKWGKYLYNNNYERTTQPTRMTMIKITYIYMVSVCTMETCTQTCLMLNTFIQLEEVYW